MHRGTLVSPRVYNVQTMAKPFRVAEARARFGEMLDQAQKGAEVVIERHGVRFRLVAESAPTSPRVDPQLFDYVDEDVASGNWTWEPDAAGVRFAARRTRR